MVREISRINGLLMLTTLFGVGGYFYFGDSLVVAGLSSGVAVLVWIIIRIFVANRQTIVVTEFIRENGIKDTLTDEAAPFCLGEVRRLGVGKILTVTVLDRGINFVLSLNESRIIKWEDIAEIKVTKQSAKPTATISLNSVLPPNTIQIPWSEKFKVKIPQNILIS